MPGLVLVAWPLPREPGRGWRSLEEPGGAGTSQLLLAGSGGPSAASPESCRDSERAAHCWHSCVLQGLAQRNLGPRNAQTLLLHPKHLSRARLCPLIGTAWLPAGDSHRLVVTPSPSAPRFAKPAAPWLKLPQCPISLTLETMQRRERKRSCFSSWSLMVLSPVHFSTSPPRQFGGSGVFAGFKAQSRSCWCLYSPCSDVTHRLQYKHE